MQDRKRFLDRADKRKQRKQRRKAGLEAEPYSTPQWKKARREFLSNVPVCDNCNTERATVVDHKKPHRGDPTLFWDMSNWQALCRRCHNRKTALTDSSFAGQRGIVKPEAFCGEDGMPIDPNHPWNKS